MKQYDETFVPRKQELNKALVELGQKIHVDKRKKGRYIEKQRRQRREQIEDSKYED